MKRPLSLLLVVWKPRNHGIRSQELSADVLSTLFFLLKLGKNEKHVQSSVYGTNCMHMHTGLHVQHTRIHVLLHFYQVFFLFLAHLNGKLKLASLIICRPSKSLYIFFSIFIFFCRTTGPISTNLSTEHPWEREFNFVQMQGNAIFQEEIIMK